MHHESSITQHRAEYTEELSNIQKGHLRSHTEKRPRASELESSSAVAESSIAGPQERPRIMASSIEDERNALRADVCFLQRSLEGADGAARRLKFSNEPLRLTLQNVTEELDEKRSELGALQQQSVDRLATALERANRWAQCREKGGSHAGDDEEAISASYDRLRRFHVECLAEIDRLVGIAQWTCRTRRCGCGTSWITATGHPLRCERKQRQMGVVEWKRA